MYRGLDVLSSDMYENHVFLSSLRSLRERSHRSLHVPSDNDGRTISVSGTWGTPGVPISLTGVTRVRPVRLDVHIAHSASLTSQAIRDSLDGQPKDKPHELA